MRTKSSLGRAFARLAAVALAACLYEAAVGEAAVCRGEAACACGDRVEGSVKLVADVTGCASAGLVLAAGARLDCAGHWIRGTDRGGAPYRERVDALGATAGVKLDSIVGEAAAARDRFLALPRPDRAATVEFLRSL